MPLATRARGANLSTLLGIIGVTVPNTRDYRLRAQLVKAVEYRFTRLRCGSGDSDVTGRLTITNAARLHLDAQMTTRNVLDIIIHAAPFIGFNPGSSRRSAVAAAAATGAAPARIMPDAVRRRSRRCGCSTPTSRWRIASVRSRNLPIDVDLTLDLERGAAGAVAADDGDGAGQRRVGRGLRYPAAAERGALRHPPRADAARAAAGGLWRRRIGHQRHGARAHRAGGARRHDPRVAGDVARADGLRARRHLLDAQRAIVRARHRYLRAEDVHEGIEGAGADQLRAGRLHRARRDRGGPDPDRHARERDPGAWRVQLRDRGGRSRPACRFEAVQPVLRPVAGRNSR
ncbi:hypothetical protein AB5I41_20775 [Sphingomonas sp. MMS24-JH45]